MPAQFHLASWHTDATLAERERLAERFLDEHGYDLVGEMLKALAGPAADRDAHALAIVYNAGVHLARLAATLPLKRNQEPRSTRGSRMRRLHGTTISMGIPRSWRRGKRTRHRRIESRQRSERRAAERPFDLGFSPPREQDGFDTRTGSRPHRRAIRSTGIQCRSCPALN